MSFSMMYKRMAVCLLSLLWLALPVNVQAEEEPLPPAEILVVYADGADEVELAKVRTFVELLTWQSFQVTFAAASDCSGNLADYENIILYEVNNYPRMFIRDLFGLEKEEGRRLLFVGSGFLKDYLDQTGRRDSYLEADREVASLTYTFHSRISKDTLVRADSFLFLNGAYDYSSGAVTVGGQEGYFCARQGPITHICSGDTDNALIRAALTRESAQWKWPYSGEPHAYAQYMVLDKVYPFQDTDKLLQIIELMADRKEPFLISVMPVYANGTYPAMQRFCEVLRYAQDHGGVILMHSPIIQMTELDVDTLNDYIAEAIGNYIAQGVYPMGIEVPHNWLFNEDTVGIMGRFRTVLVSKEEDPAVSVDKGMNANVAYRDGHQWIAPAVSLDADGTSYIKVHSTAVLFDISEDIDEIEARMEACRSSFVPLKSLWDVDHSLWTEEDVISYENGVLLVNGKRADTRFVPTEYEKKYSYNRNMLQRFSKDLSQGNRKLLLVVAAVSLLFLLFILLARRNNRKRFFYKEEDKGDYWENKK